jgi:hypothetical protein
MKPEIILLSFVMPTLEFDSDLSTKSSGIGLLRSDWVLEMALCIEGPVALLESEVFSMTL